MYFQKLLACATQLPEYTLRFDGTTGLVTHDIVNGRSRTEPIWSFVETLYYDCGDQVPPEDFEEAHFIEKVLHGRVTKEDLSEIRTYLENNVL